MQELGTAWMRKQCRWHCWDEEAMLDALLGWGSNAGCTAGK